MSFVEFVELYKAFSVRMRKDLRDLFNDVIVRHKQPDKAPCSARAVTPQTSLDAASSDGASFSDDKTFCVSYEITRNTRKSHELSDRQRKIYNALATASIQNNSAGMDTSRSSWLCVQAFKMFLHEEQSDFYSDEQVAQLIQVRVVVKICLLRSFKSF